MFAPVALLFQKKTGSLWIKRTEKGAELSVAVAKTESVFHFYTAGRTKRGEPRGVPEMEVIKDL